MKLLPTIFLSAFLAGPLHAQECSGGNAGGIDATGNQCSTLSDVAAYDTSSAKVPSTPTAKMGGARPAIAATTPALPSAKMAGATSPPSVGVAPSSRMARTALPALQPVKTSKVDVGSTSLCAGGATGGMDATGNECGEAPIAGTVSIVARNSPRR